MTEHAIVEYVANVAWQVPLLAAGAAALIKLARPELRTQYWMWISVLALAVLLPMRGTGDEYNSRPGSTTHQATEKSAPAFLSAPAQTPSYHAALMSAGSHGLQLFKTAAIQARGFTLQLSPRATLWFVAVYFVAIALAARRLLLSWLRARSLVRNAYDAELDLDSLRTFEQAGAALGIDLPRLCESTDIAGPMIVGIVHPVLLLPVAARHYAVHELHAALLHELAHVRRRDYLANLLCETAMLPISWHPFALAIERRIQQTREMLCDEMAATQMKSGDSYARCLVSVARQIMQQPVAAGHTQSLGFFDRNMLEERVMRLTSERSTMAHRGRAIHTMTGIAAMAAVLGIAISFHVKPAFAAVAQSAAAPSPGAPAVVTQPRPSPKVHPGNALILNAPTAAQKPSTPSVIARGSHAAITPEKGEYVHQWTDGGGEPFTMVNRDAHEPNEEEQAAIEQQFDDMQQRHDREALRLDLPNLNLNLDRPDIRLNLDQLKLQMDNTRVTLDQDEIKREVEHAQHIMNDPALKKQMEDFKRLSKLDTEKQFAELKLNPPHIDLDLQLDMANKALLNADVAKNLQQNQLQMQDLQEQLQNGELKAKLDAATRMLEDVRKQLQDLQAKPK
jgi:beta-lactamase regulating signal transducer with metallopeptidase domain